MLSTVKEAIKKIPGALPAYTKINELYFECMDTLGFVPRKDRLVSKDYWDKRSAENWEYDRQQDATYSAALEELLQELDSLQWGSLLEVGCGYGRVLAAIYRRFPERRLAGVDFSQNQLNRAHEFLAHTRVELFQADAKHLPFQDHEFDVVLTTASLIYVHPSELPSVLQELCRVGRQHLILTEYAREHTLTPVRERLLITAPYYAHWYTPLLLQKGIRIRKSSVLKAWEEQPNRLPLSLIIGDIGGNS